MTARRREEVIRRRMVSFNDDSESTFEELYSLQNNNDNENNNNKDWNTHNKNSRSAFLPSWLIDRLAQCGYTKPTPIQRKSLDAFFNHNHNHNNNDPNNNNNHDNNNNKNSFLLQSQTGSGKTLAYVLPLLSTIDPTRSATQALVVVPTRELGLQVTRVLRRLCSVSTSTSTSSQSNSQSQSTPKLNFQSESKLESNSQSESEPEPESRREGGLQQRIVVMHLLEGSKGFERERAWAWSDPPHIVVATPRELYLLMSRGALKYRSVGCVVVDEVDACLLGAGDSRGAAWNNNHDKHSHTSSSSSTSSLTMAGPLHELLSRYLSPTYDDSDYDKILDNTDISSIANSNYLQTSSLSSSTSSSSSSSSSFTHKQQSSQSSQQQQHSYAMTRKTIFASATIPQHNHFLKQCVQNQWTLEEPLFLRVSPGELLPPTLTHGYVLCHSMKHKFKALTQLLKRQCDPHMQNNHNHNHDDVDHDESYSSMYEEDSRILVFCDPERPMEDMASSLSKRLGGVLWYDQHKSSSSSSSSSAKKGSNGGGDDGNGGRENDQHEIKNSSLNIVWSVLRYDDSLTKRASAMQAFRGSAHSQSSQTYSHQHQQLQTHSKLSQSLSPTAPSTTKTLRILLSTDLAARGLDLPHITHVLNYDLPNDGDTYIHRSGRAGRMGQRGQVISILTEQQEFVLRRLANSLDLRDLKCLGRQKKHDKKQKKEEEENN